MYPDLILSTYENGSVFLELPIIITKGASEKCCLALEDLIYVESFQHRLLLHTVHGILATRCTFADLTACLAASGRFFRTGKGLLINFSYVSFIEADGAVLLKNGQTLFCSRRRKRETRKAFWIYRQRQNEERFF